MVENIPCPIWGTQTNPTDFYMGDGLNVDSPRAGGKYFLDGRALTRVGDLTGREKARLTTWLIEKRRSNDERPSIMEYDIDNIIQRPELSPTTRADRLLEYIQETTQGFGIEFKFPKGAPPMEMLAYTESVNGSELLSLLDYLIEQNWLEEGHETLRTKRVAMTVEGTVHLAELETVNAASSQAFVAMWYDKSLDAAWKDAIKPAIEITGYKAVRIDEEKFLNKIDEQILDEIKKSRFVVADFTQGPDGARGGVYFEAGFALGIGIPVIFTCRKNSFSEIHFNTRQYPHIVWENPAQLRDRLTSHIPAVIGDEPLESVLGEQETT